MHRATGVLSFAILLFAFFTPTVQGAVESQYSVKATVLYLSCPRIAYADSMEVTVICLEEGVACNPEEVHLEGAEAEFVTQSGQALVYRAQVPLAGEYKLSVSHPSLSSASCNVLRADTSPPATVPDFNVWLLPLLSLVVIVFLKNRS